MATTPQQSIPPDEAKEVQDIVHRYFLKTYDGNQGQAAGSMNQLANLLKNPAAKLVHLGNTVFLILVKDKGVVEFHTMTADDDSNSMAKNIVMLTKYLKNIGAHEVYTYSDDPKLAVVAKRTRLPYTTKQTKGHGDKDYTVYTMELK